MADIWLDTTAIAAMISVSQQAIRKRIGEFTTRRVGVRHEILLSSLPEVWQRAWRVQQAAAEATPVAVDPAREALWAWYARRPGTIKAEAERRLTWMQRLQAALDDDPDLYVTHLARALAVKDPSAVTLIRWWAKIKDAPRQDWLALLAPGNIGNPNEADCSPEAWDFFVGEYLSRRRTPATLCYERTQRAAAEHGWTLPSLKTLQRRLTQSVSQGALTLARQGAEPLRDTFKTLRRDPRSFHAGEMVSGDGLKFDTLWIRWPDGEILNTTTAWFWQDGYSNKLLAYRVDKTENADLFRLAFYDLTAITLPRLVLIDNTRAAANKVMTGRAPGRHRFKDRPDDLEGALVQLGCHVHWADPNHDVTNPGSKPIERSFGIGGIHERVRTHPRFAERGYRSDKAIDLAEFLEVLAEEVTAWNAKPKRRTVVCGGELSYAQAFEDSYQKATIHLPTRQQRQLLLLIPAVCTCRAPSGEITLPVGKGPHGDNRYWCERLSEHLGESVVAYYDPAYLHEPLAVYTRDGRFIADVPCNAPHGWGDTQAMREHLKEKRRYLRARKQEAASASRLSALERSDLLPAVPVEPPLDPKVVRVDFGPPPGPPARDDLSDDDPESEDRADQFRRGLARLREQA